jgi:hypothetical protein
MTAIVNGERVLFIGTQFSVLYTSVYSPCICKCKCLISVNDNSYHSLQVHFIQSPGNKLTVSFKYNHNFIFNIIQISLNKIPRNKLDLMPPFSGEQNCFHKKSPRKKLDAIPHFVYA